MTVTKNFNKQFEKLSNELYKLIKENKSINTTHKSKKDTMIKYIAFYHEKILYLHTNTT